jgi:diadenosine tetraphosphate (Ap4A) HIT family hydrolase
MVVGQVASVRDGYPVTDGHCLIVPLRHTEDYLSMTAQERLDADTLMRLLIAELRRRDPFITGFNIGMNCGWDAGQTVFHAHIHLIPRRPGDTPNPRGGVRGVIPEKMDYR